MSAEYQFIIINDTGQAFVDDNLILVQHIPSQEVMFVPYKLKDDGKCEIYPFEKIPVTDNILLLMRQLLQYDLSDLSGQGVLRLPKNRQPEEDVRSKKGGQPEKDEQLENVSPVNGQPESADKLLQTGTFVVAAQKQNLAKKFQSPNKAVQNKVKKLKSPQPPKYLKRLGTARGKATSTPKKGSSLLQKSQAVARSLSSIQRLQSSETKVESMMAVTTGGERSIASTSATSIIQQSDIDQAQSFYWKKLQREIDEDEDDFERELLADDESSSLSSPSPTQSRLPSDLNVGAYLISDNPIGDNPTSDNRNVADGAKQLALWKRDDTRELISMYKQLKHLFESNDIKKKTVWKQVAEKLKPYTARQCSNRWKYLRTLYLQKLANMSSATTGKRRFMFEYFEDMDDVLQQSRSIHSPYLASIEDGEFQEKSQIWRPPSASACESTADEADNPAAPSTEEETFPRTTGVATEPTTIGEATAIIGSDTFSTSRNQSLTTRQEKIKHNREKKELLREAAKAINKIADAICALAAKL